jgi:hypothetical protein
MKKKKGIVVRPPQLTEDRRTRGRAIMTLKLLWQLMKAARDQAGPVIWLNEGGLDAEEFLECLETGRPHPLLRRWQVMKGTTAANRPAPTSRERAARRIVVLAVIGLQRVASMTGKEARLTVAAAMPKLFEEPPSDETIHYWERQRDPPTTTPAEETFLAMVIANSNADPAKVVERVLDLAHTILTPAPFSPPSD